MTLFKNKYRVETTRLKDWDYTAAGWYFVTICTRQRESFFGEIENGEMRLNALGDFAARCWVEISQHFPKASIDVFVVMPNHLHGIVALADSDTLDAQVETRHVASLPDRYVYAANKFGPLRKGSVSKIIQAYKATVKKWSGLNNHPEFNWHPRFYDHIIRTPNELTKIRQYIVNNPAKWDLEHNNPENLWM